MEGSQARELPSIIKGEQTKSVVAEWVTIYVGLRSAIIHSCEASLCIQDLAKLEGASMI